MEPQHPLDKLKEHNVNPIVMLMAFVLGVTIIVFIERMINDLSSWISMLLTQSNITFTVDATAKAVSSTVITVPLFLVALFLYIMKKDNHVDDPWRISAVTFFITMVITLIFTVSTVISFLYEINSTVAAYGVCILIIGALVFGIFRLQKHTNRTQVA